MRNKNKKKAKICCFQTIWREHSFLKIVTPHFHPVCGTDVQRWARSTCSIRNTQHVAHVDQTHSSENLSMGLPTYFLWQLPVCLRYADTNHILMPLVCSQARHCLSPYMSGRTNVTCPFVVSEGFGQKRWAKHANETGGWEIWVYGFTTVGQLVIVSFYSHFQMKTCPKRNRVMLWVITRQQRCQITCRTTTCHHGDNPGRTTDPNISVVWHMVWQDTSAHTFGFTPSTPTVLWTVCSKRVCGNPWTLSHAQRQAGHSDSRSHVGSLIRERKKHNTSFLILWFNRPNMHDDSVSRLRLPDHEQYTKKFQIQHVDGKKTIKWAGWWCLDSPQR